MSEHKIEDCTSVLYNVIFLGKKKGNKCSSSKCETGKCICMDIEQSGLLRKVLSEEDQIGLSFDGEQFSFRNLQGRRFERAICQQAIQGEVLFENRFMLPEDEEILYQIIEEYKHAGGNLMDVIKSIPTIHMTNALHDMNERDSLIYLCKYSPCTEMYMSVLFRAAICTTIGYCERADMREKEQYVGKLIELFKRLATSYGQDDEDAIKAIIGSLDQYFDGWKQIRNEQYEGRIRNIQNELEVYIKELKNEETRRIVKNEEKRCSKLYSILKKILKTANISVKDFPKLPFADYEDKRTDYDKVINILDGVKKDATKRAEIWSILSGIFWMGEDIPTDEIKRMERIAGMAG